MAEVEFEKVAREKSEARTHLSEVQTIPCRLEREQERRRLTTTNSRLQSVQA